MNFKEELESCYVNKGRDSKEYRWEQELAGRGAAAGPCGLCLGPPRRRETVYSLVRRRRPTVAMAGMDVHLSLGAVETFALQSKRNTFVALGRKPAAARSSPPRCRLIKVGKRPKRGKTCTSSS